MRVTVPLVIGLLGAVPAAAQRGAPPARTWWASVGAGFGWLEELGDLGMHAAVSVQSGPHVVSVRVATATGVLSDLFSLSNDADAVTDFGILYGRGTTRGPVRGSVGIGLGVAEVMRGGEPSNTWYPTLPLEAQVTWRPLGFLGVGIYVFSSVNREQSFGGLAFMVQAGRLR